MKILKKVVLMFLAFIPFASVAVRAESAKISLQPSQGQPEAQADGAEAPSVG